MPDISMLIKPASSLCNMRCKYCFYCDEANNRDIGSYGVMSRETAEILIKRALDESTGAVSFAFQGGEPTLAGLGFFKYFTDTVKAYNGGRRKVSYAMQTNGIFDDREEWAEFFCKNSFLIGLSFDGTRELHDFNRVDASDKGTAARVIKCAETFDKFRVDYNILTVVTPYIAKRIRKIYSFYMNNDWIYMQYIPCLSPLGGEKSRYTLDESSWLNFNKTLFDLWYEDNITYVKNNMPLAPSIRHFDDYLSLAAGLRPESCGSCGVCAIQNVIEADGSVYPCDFYALDEYLLGNIRDMTLRELFECERAQEFIKSSAAHEEKCRQCKWYSLCAGGCRRYKNNGMYIYCDAAMEFYDYTYERIKKMAAQFINGRRGTL